jgi:tRNA-dihydrouridine synthase B
MSSIIGLSPMDGITDEAFRLVQCKISKPDIIFTEFVSAEGIAHGAVKLFDQLLYSNVERPIIAQLFGKDPQSFYFATIILCHLGFDGVDINMGCPAKTVIQHGSGAALINNPDLAKEIIKSTKTAIDDFKNKKTKLSDLKLKKKSKDVIDRNLKYSKYQQDDKNISISVKTRLGVSESVIDTWIPFLLDQDLDFITLHGRTLKQGYAGTADWSEIFRASNFFKNHQTKLIGNGDIQSRSQGIDFCQKYNLDGVLIGRAALGNPWAFSDHVSDNKEKFETLINHVKNYLKIFPDRRFDPLRRYLLAYSKGLKNAKELRSKLVTIENIDALLCLEEDFING